MEKQEKVIIDFTECKYFAEMHKRIKDGLDFPDHYGENLDALWDLISEPRDAFITIKGIHDLPKSFDEYIENLLKIFEEAKELHKQYGCNFDFTLE